MPASDVWTGLVDGPIDLGAVHDHLADDRAGGVCVFVGRSRRWTDGPAGTGQAVETDLLSYDAYRPMAEAELAGLAATARERWGALRVVVLHRLGDVPPPQASVAVGVACPHRAEAFAAARWLIDTLKGTVPVWKTERAPDHG